MNPVSPDQQCHTDTQSNTSILSDPYGSCLRQVQPYVLMPRVAFLDVDPPLQEPAANVKPEEMQIERFKFFRWTPRTTFISLLFVGVIPGIFGYMGYVTDVSDIGI